MCIGCLYYTHVLWQWVTEIAILLVICSNIANMKKQLIDLGCSFDWHRVSHLSTLLCVIDICLRIVSNCTFRASVQLCICYFCICFELSGTLSSFYLMSFIVKFIDCSFIKLVNNEYICMIILEHCNTGAGNMWPTVLQMDSVHIPSAVQCWPCLSERGSWFIMYISNMLVSVSPLKIFFLCCLYTYQKINCYQINSWNAVWAKRADGSTVFVCFNCMCQQNLTVWHR